MRNVLRLGLRLLAVALAAGLLLGMTNYLTQGPIEAQRVKQAEEARLNAYSGADAFEEAAYAGDDATITSLHTAKSGGQTVGYVVGVAPKGYGGVITITVGVDTQGRVVGVVIGQNSETPGLGKKVEDEGFYLQYVGQEGPFELGHGVDAITGATISSRAVTDGINAAIAAAQGGE